MKEKARGACERKEEGKGEEGKAREEGYQMFDY